MMHRPPEIAPGFGSAKLTKEDVMKIFAQADQDGNGSVTRREFIREMISTAKSGAPSGEKSGTDASKTPGAEEQRGDRSGPPQNRGFGGGPGRFGGGFGGFGAGPGLGPFGFRGPRPHGPPSASMLMDRFDNDKKGSLSKSDVPAFVWDRISKADTNSDGSVSKDELEIYFKNHRPGRPATGGPSNPGDKPADGKPEEQKPDKSAPSAMKQDAERPADATAASNVVAAN